MTMLDRERAVIGTLAHNRRFTAREVTEYTRFETRPLNGPAVVRRLVRAGLLTRVARGHYFPTPEGWAEIERIYVSNGDEPQED